MKKFHHRRPLYALLCVIMVFCLYHCGSSSIVASGGIGGSGIISKGTILAFGSIVVHGIEFDTGNAQIFINGDKIGVGDAVALDSLKIGMVVTVEGSGDPGEDNAVADRVMYDRNVEGPVQDIIDLDTATKEITVMGQRVVVYAGTIFQETTFDTIALGDVVEVSGFFNDTGTIWATFIRRTGVFVPGLILEVSGRIDNLDPNSQTFVINGLTVDYSMADTHALPGGMPAENLRVEVEGPLNEVGDIMFATEIDLADELDGVDSYNIEITGFVTEFDSISAFVVGSQMVQANENTVFVDGTLSDVALGVKLEAEGSFHDGVLVADEIEFWEPDQIEVEGTVTDVASITEFTVADHTVITTAETVFDGGTAQDISLGTLIEIKGRSIDGILIADKVSFEEY